MAVTAQVFTGTHADAIARADALDAGRPVAAGPHVDLGVAPFAVDVTPWDLDELGQIAARIARFGSGDTEPLEVDLDHEGLFELPEFWCQVLAELTVAEDPEALDDVAQAWAETEEMADAGDLAPLVRALVDLTTGAREAGVGVYLWVAQD